MTDSTVDLPAEEVKKLGISVVPCYFNVGFILFCGWIVYCEKNLLFGLLLVIIVMVLVNFIASAYALWALICSQGDDSENEDDRVDAIHAIDHDSGPWLFPDLVKLIKDPSWRICVEVCRTLSFLLYSQALLLLEKAATDPDWTVRSNAVRAIGKLSDLGEHALLRIIKGEDRFACEVALAVLKHQGFLERNNQRLSSPDRDEVKRGITFIQILEQNGHSRLAHAALESFLKDSNRSKSEAVTR